MEIFLSLFIEQNKMRITLLWAAFAICGIANAQTPAWCWGRGSVGTGHDEGRNVAIDASGNVYVTGSFNSQLITFGPYTLSTSSGNQVFLVKYNLAGDILWASSSSGSGGNGYGIATDTSGSIYLTGTFNSSIAFGPYTLTNGGVFLVKYDENGNVLWAKSAGGINDGANDAATDASGNIYLTGSFYSPSITFGAYTLINAGGNTPYDLFLAKYDAAGNVLWATSAGSSDGAGEYGYGVASNADGGIYITGYLGAATVAFDSYIVNGPGFFLTNYDSTGNVLWAKYNANNDEGKGVSTDGFGNIYVRTDNELIKYNSFGSVVWTKILGGIGYDVATDLNGNTYSTASFNSTVTIDSYTFSFPPGGDPMYIAKCDSGGNVLCAAALASGGDDRDGVAADLFGNAYIGGDYMVNPFIVGTDTLPFVPDESIFVSRFTCGSCDTAMSPNFYSLSTFLCEKFCTNFTDQSTNNPTSWQWSFPGGMPSSSTDQNPTNICYNNSGTYDVTLITTNAGGSDTLTLSNYITVYSTPPFPTITQNGSVLTCSPAAAYQWQLNSIDISGATQQSYTYSQPGLYTVLAYDSNGCSNYASADVTGVENVASEFSVSVFPNPLTGSTTISFSLDKNTPITIGIFDLAGRKMKALLDENAEAGDHQIQLNREHLSAGIYFLKVKMNQETFRIKILIE
ncbi:MAG TPA: T9SS type A sorting domain-containing protein [Chitinophagales bacterium]|nr:T9SS type A sorting domain-containing protein [Chitinophagales bacterium]